MIKEIVNILSDVSLSKDSGRFLSDKSYGFDTIYFIAKFILHNAKDNKFSKRQLKPEAIDYTADIFNLDPNASGTGNYFNEVVNLLTYGNVLVTDNSSNYTIAEPEILSYIAECPENAYIYLYLLTYMTLKNDGLLPNFVEYAKAEKLTDKSAILQKIYEDFMKKSVSIESGGTNWSKQLVKYSMTVWGFINKQNYISRELNVNDKLFEISDIALNVPGKKTRPQFLPKKNGYLKTFNIDYVKYKIKPYLLRKEKIAQEKTAVTESIENGLAELKLAMIDATADKEKKTYEDRQQFLEAVVRTRNQTIQNKFKKDLLKNSRHVCPICGFSVEEFLIASHIMPYAQCSKTEDAINYHNGFLMCPNHDRLFEDAKYMTIDSDTGEIILSEEMKRSKEFGRLSGTVIDKVYLTDERKEYLEWHNKRFTEHNEHK